MKINASSFIFSAVAIVSIEDWRGSRSASGSGSVVGYIEVQPLDTRVGETGRGDTRRNVRRVVKVT